MLSHSKKRPSNGKKMENSSDSSFCDRIKSCILSLRTERMRTENIPFFGRLFNDFEFLSPKDQRSLNELNGISKKIDKIIQ